MNNRPRRDDRVFDPKAAHQIEQWRIGADAVQGWQILGESGGAEITGHRRREQFCQVGVEFRLGGCRIVDPVALHLPPEYHATLGHHGRQVAAGNGIRNDDIAVAVEILPYRRFRHGGDSTRSAMRFQFPILPIHRTV
jgi:hypothetical protein